MNKPVCSKQEAGEAKLTGTLYGMAEWIQIKTLIPANGYAAEAGGVGANMFAR
jgi:hypothetical protein